MIFVAFYNCLGIEKPKARFIEPLMYFSHFCLQTIHAKIHSRDEDFA